jgi:hypothetical protein
MIRINVEDYCQSCMEFSPDIAPPVRSFSENGAVKQTDTIIQCKHRKRCETITRYLVQQMKGEVSG